MLIFLEESEQETQEMSAIAQLAQEANRLHYALERRHRCDICNGTGTDWFVDEDGETVGDPCSCWILADDVLSNGQIMVEGPETVWCCQEMARSVESGPLAESEGRVFFSPEDNAILRYCPFCGCRLLRKTP